MATEEVGYWNLEIDQASIIFSLNPQYSIQNNVNLRCRGSGSLQSIIWRRLTLHCTTKPGISYIYVYRRVVLACQLPTVLIIVSCGKSCAGLITEFDLTSFRKPPSSPTTCNEFLVYVPVQFQWHHHSMSSVNKNVYSLFEFPFLSCLNMTPETDFEKIEWTNLMYQ